MQGFLSSDEKVLIFSSLELDIGVIISGFADTNSPDVISGEIIA